MSNSSSDIDWTIPSYNFDWSGESKIYGKTIPHDIVESKYSLYDNAVSLGLIGVDYHATQLLSDDTIYAYAFLKWENKPIKLRYFQDSIMSDDFRRIDVEAANQQGKSFSLCTKASVKFLRDHGKNTTIGLISKSMSQNSMNMRMVRKMLKDAAVSYTPGSNDNMTVMVHDLGNGFTNTLVCSVASTSALGFPFDYLLLDEFEFWENPEGLEYMFDQVLDPRTFNTNGQIIIYSNPNGRNFVSENLHQRSLKVEHPTGSKTLEEVRKEYPLAELVSSENGRDVYDTNQKEFHVYNINFLDNPDNSVARWEQKKVSTHPIIFASTMAALRTESEGSALTQSDIDKTKCSDLDDTHFYGLDKRENWWFLDLGFVYDQNVLVACYKTLVDERIQYNFAVKCYPVNHPSPELWGTVESEEESVPHLVNRYGGDEALFELDLTGKEGNEVNAHNAGLRCNGVKMSGPWKAKWYDRLISLIKQGRIKVQNITNWLDGHNKNFEFQARSLRISTKTPDGRTRAYPLYHHSSEKDHDDILDAIVGCLSLCDDELDDGSSYDTSYIQTKTSKESNETVQSFEDIKSKIEIPSFIKEKDLKEWYEKRYGLQN